MIQIIENVRFIQDGTMVFGDIYLVDGFVERIYYKTLKGPSDLVIPGFVDLHIHGYHNYNCESTNPHDIHKMAVAMAKRGIVGFCPTITPRPYALIEKMIEAYHSAFMTSGQFARFLGFHLEGPYLSEKRLGAIDPTQIREIDLDELETFLHKYHDDIAIMSIAPECVNGIEAVEMLNRYGVIASIGHSNATYEECMDAFAHGVRHVTHLGNAMSEANHRQATMSDAIFNHNNVKCELICDGVHNDKRHLQWLIPMLGFDRVMVISDGTRQCGMKYADQHQFKDGSIVVKDAIYKEGILMGSTKDILDDLPLLYEEFEYSIDDIIKMTSINAMKSLNESDSTISLGKKVDLIVLDQHLKLKEVYINGNIVK
ncbi:MAG: N-acetylglucosamine-6-phosphate deacetylase [Erysipelotrichaceae bacterium]